MIDKLSHFLSGEFLLRKRPNGGGVILARSLFVTSWFYPIALGIKIFTSERPVHCSSFTALLADVNATIPWAGAIFAGVYTVFYTRYSSQWLYLASVYNKIIEVKVSLPKNVAARNDSLVDWQAGFVSDAFTLHLDTKPIFKGVIEHWLTDEDMKRAIVSNLDANDLHEFNVRHECKLCVCLNSSKASPLVGHPETGP
ncbi:MAG: hypothetical protein RIQ71_873 [Verrucomicrobiota bacterium]|jgi:hypothetical protein